MKPIEIIKAFVAEKLDGDIQRLADFPLGSLRSDNVYIIYDEKNELLDSHQIAQNDAGIDIEERVEIGLQMIKKWIL